MERRFLVDTLFVYMAYESLDTIRALLKRLSYAPKTSATGTDMGRGGASTCLTIEEGEDEISPCTSSIPSGSNQEDANCRYFL
jgi:hypothetical protein